MQTTEADVVFHVDPSFKFHVKFPCRLADFRIETFDLVVVNFSVNCVFFVKVFLIQDEDFVPSGNTEAHVFLAHARARAVVGGVGGGLVFDFDEVNFEDVEQILDHFVFVVHGCRLNLGPGFGAVLAIESLENVFLDFKSDESK